MDSSRGERGVKSHRPLIAFCCLAGVAVALAYSSAHAQQGIVMPDAPKDGSTQELLKYVITALVALMISVVSGGGLLIGFLVKKISDRSGDLAPVLQAVKEQTEAIQDMNTDMRQIITMMNERRPSAAGAGTLREHPVGYGSAG